MPSVGRIPNGGDFWGEGSKATVAAASQRFENNPHGGRICQICKDRTQDYQAERWNHQIW